MRTRKLTSKPPSDSYPIFGRCLASLFAVRRLAGKGSMLNRVLVQGHLPTAGHEGAVLRDLWCGDPTRRSFRVELS